jgi:hypothetical protein
MQAHKSMVSVLFLALGTTYCGGGSGGGGAAGSEPAAVTGGGNATGGSTAGLDFPKLYCDSVNTLKLRSDVKEEISFFCLNGKPTREFLDFRTEALNQAPGAYKIKLLQAEHDPEGDSSEFLLAWSFRVPIRPFDVKSRPIYNYIAKDYASAEVDLKSAATPSAGALDSDLHQWSVDINYDLAIKGTQNLTLESQRTTQYNLYQVQPGNEELGFGVEHLTASANDNYKRSVMLNVSFNDGKGGSVIVTVLHFVLSNQGFPATATSAIQEIAQHAADGMYNGLKQ